MALRKSSSGTTQVKSLLEDLSRDDRVIPNQNECQKTIPRTMAFGNVEFLLEETTPRFDKLRIPSRFNLSNEFMEKPISKDGAAGHFNR